MLRPYATASSANLSASLFAAPKTRAVAVAELDLEPLVVEHGE